MSVPTKFAHLLGLGRRPRGAKADEPLQDDPLDQQYAKDDEDEPKAKGKARGKRAEDDDDKPDAEDDENDPDAEDDEDEPKAKGKARGKRAEDDDDKPDAEDDDEEKPSASVARERARCAHIMAYGLKNGMGNQAFVMAFDSNMSKSAAINVLKANKAFAPKPGAGAHVALGQAMGALGVHQVSPEGSAELPAGIDATTAMIIKAGM